MPVTLAIRFDSAKNAAIAAMSQMSSSEKPWPASAAKSASSISCAPRRDLHREIEHRPLARRDVGLAVVDRDLVGDQRVLGADAQDRAMRDHAIMALVGGRGRDHDHLALGLGQAAVLLHQRVVIGEEGAELVGPVGQRQEHVRARSPLSPARRAMRSRMSSGSLSSGGGKRFAIGCVMGWFRRAGETAIVEPYAMTWSAQSAVWAHWPDSFTSRPVAFPCRQSRPDPNVRRIFRPRRARCRWLRN